VLDRPAGELGAAAQAGLLADAREVVLDRARRDVELLADLVVGEPVGDEAQDLELARRQQRADRRALAARAARELAQQVAGELGRDDRAAAMDRDDRSRLSGLSLAVMTSARISGSSARRRSSTTAPPRPGMRRSSTMTSGFSWRASSIAVMPLSASPMTSMPGSRSSARMTPSRTSGWSSATSTRIFTPPPPGAHWW
jgi:hypothetical protein